MLFTVVIISAVLLVVYWLQKWSERRRMNYPPSPRFTLPLLGDALTIGSDMLAGYGRLSQTYGDVFVVEMLINRVMVLNSLETISEAMGRDEFQGRPRFQALIKARGSETEPPGIILSDGPNWTEMRRFTLQTLRDFGFGKGGMEGMVREEVELFCQHMQETTSADAPATVHGRFHVPVLNALWRIITSERLSYGDPKLENLVHLMDRLMRDVGKPINMLLLYNAPLAKATDRLGMHKMFTCIETMRNMAAEIRAEHESTFTDGSPRDFVDVYIAAQKAAKNGFFVGPFGDLNLENVIVDLLIAGSETTSTSLSWCMLYMAKYQEVQEKIQEEIRRAVGSTRLPEWKDRTELPYTEFVLLEIQRMSCIAPLAAAHCTTKDTELAGFFVPKNTTVFVNLHAVTTSKDCFEEPDVFRPDRFLENGKFVNDSNVVIFGLGKRRCLGETLARMELFLFFAGIVQRFSIRSAPGETYDVQAAEGFTLVPKPFKVLFVPR